MSIEEERPKDRGCLLFGTIAFLALALAVFATFRLLSYERKAAAAQMDAGTEVGHP